MSAAARRRLPSNVDPRTGRIRTSRVQYVKGARFFINGKEVSGFSGMELTERLDPDVTYAKPLPGTSRYEFETTAEMPMTLELAAHMGKI